MMIDCAALVTNLSAAKAKGDRGRFKPLPKTMSLRGDERAETGQPGNLGNESTSTLDAIANNAF
jgi:hypothetical protein